MTGNIFVVSTEPTNDSTMRLSAIEKPRGIFLKLAYWYSEKEFGKVIAPLKYIYARSIPIAKVSLKMIGAEKRLTLSREIIQCIRYYTSHRNDCPFCSDINAYTAQKANLALQEWKEFLDFRISRRFTEQEKALLAYLEDIYQTRSATDETFTNLKKYFSEKEIVEITWVNASENYLNLIAKPLGLPSDGLGVRNGKSE